MAQVDSIDKSHAVFAKYQALRESESEATAVQQL